MTPENKAARVHKQPRRGRPFLRHGAAASRKYKCARWFQPPQCAPRAVADAEQRMAAHAQGSYIRSSFPRAARKATWSTVERGDPYGFAKLGAEQLVMGHARSRGTYDVVAINPVVVFGPCLTKAHTARAPCRRNGRVVSMVVDSRRAAAWLQAAPTRRHPAARAANTCWQYTALISFLAYREANCRLVYPCGAQKASPSFVRQFVYGNEVRSPSAIAVPAYPQALAHARHGHTRPWSPTASPHARSLRV